MPAQPPIVSVIIPNYNHAPYLRQRIDSVLTQTFQDIEVIILDDASKDNSREIIKEYQHDARVRLVFNESNSGCVFRQWNKGLKLAVGKYVWIAESDDYSAPTFLETLVGRLESDPGLGLAFCDSYRVCEGEVSTARARWFKEFSHLYEQDFQAEGMEYVARQMLFMNTIPNASSAIFRRSTAESAGPADDSFLLSGDWIFYIKLLSRSNLAYVATPLNYYRAHPQTARQTHSSNGVMIEEAYRISLFVLKGFPVSRADAREINERLTSWFIETMISGRSSIPQKRQRDIRRLAAELNPYALPRLWLRRSGLSWLWLGCRRRVMDVWKSLPTQMSKLF
jgi:glycosyltransferase involved in cell wall biosynthesis